MLNHLRNIETKVRQARDYLSSLDADKVSVDQMAHASDLMTEAYRRVGMYLRHHGEATLVTPEMAGKQLGPQEQERSEEVLSSLQELQSQLQKDATDDEKQAEKQTQQPQMAMLPLLPGGVKGALLKALLELVIKTLMKSGIGVPDSAPQAAHRAKKASPPS